MIDWWYCPKSLIIYDQVFIDNEIRVGHGYIFQSKKKKEYRINRKWKKERKVDATLNAQSLAMYKATQANCMSNFLSHTPFEYLCN